MRAFVTDLVERVAWTYIQAFTGLLLLSWGAQEAGGQVAAVTDWSIVTKAAIAAIPAVLSLLKNVAAGFIGNPDSAATVPRSVDKKGLQYAAVPEGAFHEGVADPGSATAKDFAKHYSKVKAEPTAAHKSRRTRKRA